MPALFALLLLAADGPFALRDGQKVAFFGDSITQAGGYIADVEGYLLTRFPDQMFTLYNRGISSETISGTSEPDHAPRRPWAHERFARDITPIRPDLLVACFGMNDGNYFPFDEPRYLKYQEGVRRLIDRARAEAGAKILLLTPPPFDPYRRQVGDRAAKTYGYKFPAADYDDTLGRYAGWLVGLRKEDIDVVDIHKLLNDHLEARRVDDVSFSLAEDAVHPGPTGHLLMALAILRAWNAPAMVAEARVDAAALKVVDGAITDLHRAGGGVEFAWTSPLPMPIDPGCDARSLAIERVAETINRHRLAVVGLPPGRYRLEAGEGETRADIGTFSDVQLSAGLDLTALPTFPSTARAARVFEAVARRRQARDAAWRASLNGGPPAPEADPELPAIRKLCRPMAMRIKVSP